MTYRSLLVLLDDDPLCAARTQTAIQLAKSFDAHLTGFAPTGVLELSAVPAAAASLAELAEAAQYALVDQAHAAAKAFEHTCATSRLNACRSVVVEADIAGGLLQKAQGHDLMVLSQPDPAAANHVARRAVVERLVLFSARPILLLPYAGSFTAPYQNILVAWDGSREATRAIADALPLLRKARRVDVVTWLETGFMADTAPPAQAHDVIDWLSLHGVSAQLHSEAASAPIAEAILSRASDLDADLIVMGGYGHTRWTERLLGGATRGVLTTMTVPVLMSH
jgi:nucleotide-binding universal stress UspA family protein